MSPESEQSSIYAYESPLPRPELPRGPVRWWREVTIVLVTGALCLCVPLVAYLLTSR